MELLYSSPEVEEIRTGVLQTVFSKEGRALMMTDDSELIPFKDVGELRKNDDAIPHQTKVMVARLKGQEEYFFYRYI